MSNDPIFSIVAPIYNEAGNIPELHRRISAVMETVGEPWELVMVNDGSTDGSAELLNALHLEDPSTFAWSNSPATSGTRWPSPPEWTIRAGKPSS